MTPRTGVKGRAILAMCDVIRCLLRMRYKCGRGYDSMDEDTRKAEFGHLKGVQYIVALQSISDEEYT